MRIRQSILAIILVIISVSCQSSPQRPVGRMSQPQPAQPTAPAPEGASAAMPGETDSSKAAPADKFSEATQAKDDQGAVSKTIALGGKAKPPEKKPPIKPVIAPVQTGLLSPLTQEIPSGSPGSAQKERQRIVLNFEKADIAEVTNQIFSDQLKLNYVMDQTLQGRISMYIEGDFENDELLQMVARAYEANGISIIGPCHHLQEFVVFEITFDIHADPALKGLVHHVIELQLIAEYLVGDLGNIGFLEIKDDSLLFLLRRHGRPGGDFLGCRA